MADPRDTLNLDQQVENLARRGVALPRNAARKRLSASTMHSMAAGGMEQRHADLQGGIAGEASRIQENADLIRAMGNQRRASHRRMAAGGGMDAFAAMPRFYDPMEFWDLSGLPWNVADEGHRHKLHKWLRLYDATHYLIPILIDIFTRFPLVGMEVKSKDPALKDFYEDLFIEQLEYPDFLVRLGREYWTVGEAYPLGSFDEDLAIWEREELIDPESIVIDKYPMLGETEIKIKPPDYLKNLAQTKSPAKEFRMLELNFPEMIPYLMRDKHIPISGVLLKQVANLQTEWSDRGTPILLRGLKTLINEEKLTASQDAIAERLYSPLVLAKLGVMDLGDGQGPWVPTPDELDAFRDDLDLAMSSDFRVLVHHFGIEMESVFGREQMPRLGDDFDRIERRLMQIFGVNPSLLSAGSNSQPYASSALQAEFMNQVLRTYQGYLKKHFKERALVVAEAQGHQDYEMRGNTKVPIYEEVMKVDPETGKRYRETVPKPLIPELDFASFDLRDEATERQFLQALRMQGVPIPDSKLMVGIDYDIEEMADEYNKEISKKTIAQQRAKVTTVEALEAQGLPVPPDLAAEVGQVRGDASQVPPSASPGGLPNMPGAMGPGGDPAAGGASGGPGGQIVMPDPPAGLGPTGGGPAGAPGGSPPPISGDPTVGGGFAPPASFERRPGMPSPTSSVKEGASEPEAGESDGIAESFDTVPADESEDNPEAMRTRDRSEEDRTVDRLPTPPEETRKSYSFIDDPGYLDDEEIDGDEDTEPVGRTSGDSGLDDGGEHASERDREDSEAGARDRDKRQEPEAGS